MVTVDLNYEDNIEGLITVDYENDSVAIVNNHQKFQFKDFPELIRAHEGWKISITFDDGIDDLPF